MVATECRIREEEELMKRFVTLATVLLVGLASVQLAQAEDQSKKKKKKKAQTTSQTTPAPTKGATQTSKQRATYNQQNIQRINKSKQRNIVTNNNVQWNKKAWRHFKRTGNELSFSAAQRWNWRERHERDWWRRNNF